MRKGGKATLILKYLQVKTHVNEFEFDEAKGKTKLIGFYYN